MCVFLFLMWIAVSSHFSLIWAVLSSIWSKSHSFVLLERIIGLNSPPDKFESLLSFSSASGFWTLYDFWRNVGAGVLVSFFERRALTNSFASIVTYCANSLYRSLMTFFPAVLFSFNSSSIFLFSASCSSSSFLIFSVSFCFVAIAI